MTWKCVILFKVGDSGQFTDGSHERIGSIGIYGLWAPQGWLGRVAAKGERRRVELMQYRPGGVRGIRGTI
eukprot:4759874-Prymnesium_polylepis.1